jgi:hypothetical protein
MNTLVASPRYVQKRVVSPRPSWSGYLLLILTLIVLPGVSLKAAEKPAKQGLNLGGLPAVSYNSDEGFQYGVILNLFDYGDGQQFPAYDYSAYLEASRFTKGSSLLRFYLDTEKILPGIRSFLDISYVQEDLLPFYGFNGFQSVYDTDTLAGNRTFYAMSMRQFRLMADFKGQFGLDNLNWLLSYGFYHYSPGNVNHDKLNKDLHPGDPEYLYGTSLYDHYVNWGLIDGTEANGGAVHALKAGLLYDTRNALVNPDRGVYSEALLELAPGWLNKKPYARYSLVHRQYHALIKHRLNLAIRVGAQGKVGKNELPFYRRTQLISPFATRSNVTGLGGDNSLRGILKNRLVGDGMAYSNLELRWRAFNFDLFNQHFYIGFNGFVDLGLITDAVDMNLDGLSLADRSTYFEATTEQPLHASAGGGLKLAMNENFVVSVDMGKALDKRDGEGLGVYIKINYLF